MELGSDGLLYLVSGENSSTGVVRYNPLTNTFPDGGSPWKSTGDRLSDIASGPDGNIYVIQRSTSAVVIGIDIDTAAFLPGNYGTPFIGNNFGDAALFISPEPASLALLGLGGLLMLRRRR